MHRRIKVLTALSFLILAFAVYTPQAEAKGKEFNAVCKHIKSRYQGKKVKVPFMWLARAAVGIVRPAGIRSFRVTIFRNLKFSDDSLHREMQSIMREAFSSEWSPILRIRSREGNQIYMNMREYKKTVKVLAVKIERDEAIVVRARFNPDKLAKFVENPRIFGIGLNGGGTKNSGKNKKPEALEDKVIFEDEDGDEDNSEDTD